MQRAVNTDPDAVSTSAGIHLAQNSLIVIDLSVAYS